jgi:hypothetical protein
MSIFGLILFIYMLILISLEYYKIYNLSNYLLHVVNNELRVVKLSYSISSVIKTNFFMDFVTLVNFEKGKRIKKILVILYLLKYKKLKDIYFLNFFGMFDNNHNINFFSKFFK